MDTKRNGGIVRAQILDDSKKKHIAQKAAQARWNAQLPAALLGGKLQIAGVIVDCYVGENGERLIAGRGMQDILKLVDGEDGTRKSGSRMTRLLNNKTLRPLIYKDREPGHFQAQKYHFQGKQISGYNAEMLVSICKGMLEARNAGILKTARQATVAAQCEQILMALAETGIVALIDEATGYQTMRPADGLRNYFDSVLRKNMAVWFKRFPDEFYENIYKLKGWSWPGMSKNRYSIVGHYTNDLVWERLLPGLKEELEKRNPKLVNGQRAHKHHQWLNDETGDKLFSAQMYTILALQRACLNKTGNRWQYFLNMMDEVLPKKGTTIPLFGSVDQE